MSNGNSALRARIQDKINGLEWQSAYGCEWAYLFGVKLHINHMGDEIDWSLYGADADDDGIECGSVPRTDEDAEGLARDEVERAAVEHFQRVVLAFKGAE